MKVLRAGRNLSMTRDALYPSSLYQSSAIQIPGGIWQRNKGAQKMACLVP